MPYKNKVDYDEYQRRYQKENREKINRQKRELARKTREENPEEWERKMERKRQSNRKCLNTEAWKVSMTKAKQNKRDRYNVVKVSIGKCLNPGCGWKGEYDPCQLDFHHLDKSTKVACVSQMTSSTQRMYSEILKCTLLCANCHRLVTWGKLDGSNLPSCNLGGLSHT